MTLLIIIAILVVAVIGVFVALIFKSSVNRGKEGGAGKGAGTGKKPPLDAKQAGKLADARRQITMGKQLALRVQDQDISQQARKVLDQAENIVSTMRNQPDEIRRASQFFGYYVPTIGSVLTKYAELEQSGTDIARQKDAVKGYLADISQAFDTAYETMFKDEKLNLEVETEAMHMALKRDGLL